MRTELRRFGVPVVTIGLVLIGLWIAAPEIYTGTFSDLGTFMLVAGVVLALAAWVILITRLVPRRAVARPLAAVPVLVVGALALWPYLRPPTEVDEAFPPVVAAADAPAAAESTTTTSSTTTPSTTTTDPPPSTTTTPRAGAEPPAESTTTSTAPPTTTSTTTTTTPVPTTTAATPVELRRAGFQGLTGHRGSGQAAVYDLGAGSILLRFEGVDIGSGPALDVYLVPGADQRGTGGGVYVAPLTAERGNQNYTVPPGVDLASGTWTVLVWCETFDVEVANATLT